VTVEVEKLAAGDAGDEDVVRDLVGIVNAAYAVGEKGLWKEGFTRIEPAEIANAIRADGLLAARIDAELVGCAQVKQLEDGAYDLGLVSAAPDRWGSGIGRELVRSAEDEMRSRGVTDVQLELLVPQQGTHPAKERLREWYTRIGYRIARTAPFDEIVAHLAPQLAVPCEFLIFRKRI
jgi:GNAT superfamily N-acetyltransferase